MTDAANIPTAPRPGTMQAGAWALAACMVFFGLDVVLDAIDHIREGVFYTLEEGIHISFEIMAVICLGYGAWALRRQLALMRDRQASDAQTIRMLRGAFDQVLAGRFDDWGLTPAERDVTVLILKGLGVAEIAAARQTAAGTVKAQSTAIFRKIGVRSKSELMSVVIDEFLDSAQAA